MLRDKNHDRYSKLYRKVELNISQKSVSPDKYLKKSDMERLELIKVKLGREKEMTEIREKYKGNKPNQKYLAMVPLYKRHRYGNNKTIQLLTEELRQRQQELKLKAKPMDYEEIRAHQERFDKLKAERELNQSVFLVKTEPGINLSLLAIEEGLLNGETKKAKVQFAKNQAEVKTFLNKYDFVSLRVPAKLVDYKNSKNAWKKNHNTRKDLSLLRKEKGHHYFCEFLKKVQHRISSASRANNISQVTINISSANDIKIIDKQNGGPVPLAKLNIVSEQNGEQNASRMRAST